MVSFRVKSWWYWILRDFLTTDFIELCSKCAVVRRPGSLSDSHLMPPLDHMIGFCCKQCLPCFWLSGELDLGPRTKASERRHPATHTAPNTPPPHLHPKSLSASPMTHYEGLTKRHGYSIIQNVCGETKILPSFYARRHLACNGQFKPRKKEVQIKLQQV